MTDFTMYLPFLIPLLIAQLALGIASAIHVWRHPHYRFGNRIFWLIVVLFVQLIGPVMYFLLGRGDEL